MWIRQRGRKIAIKVKRLKDFKGKEGCEYFVHTRRKIEDMDCIPIYLFTNGKLKKTDTSGFLWFSR